MSQRLGSLLLLSLVVSLPAAARAGDHGAPSEGERRAFAALAAEFKQVQGRTQEVRQAARRVLRLLRAGDLRSLVDECTIYDAKAKDRRGLSERYLRDHAAAWRAAAKLAELDGARFGATLRFRSPEPEAGMPGRVYVSFGPPVVRPAGADPRLGPPRHELELWWSGPLMPEANGPVRATPAAGAKPGRWRLHQLTLPYTERPRPRLR